MGFIGKYYDQTREGKGVSKGEVRDKGVFNFFDVYTTNFWKFTVLGLIYILFCIPVITMPAATAAFTYVQRNIIRKKGVFIWSDFVDTFTKYFWKALPIGIIDVLAIALSVIAMWWYGVAGGIIKYQGHLNPPSVFYMIGFGVAVAFFGIYNLMRYYSYMQLVSFEFNYKQIYKNAFYLACLGFFRNLFVTILCVLILLILWSIATMGNTIGFGLAIVLIPLVVVSLRGYIINYNSFAVIYKYIVEPYEREEAEKKAEAGETEETVESIFKDMGKNPERKRR